MLVRLFICLLLSGAPLAAGAQTYQESFTSQLEAQGFSHLTISRTWLGRVRIVATRDDLRREIVFNPETGEILRDYWRTISDETSQAPRLINPNFDEDDDDVDDDEDDDELDD